MSESIFVCCLPTCPYGAICPGISQTEEDDLTAILRDSGEDVRTIMVIAGKLPHYCPGMVISSKGMTL